MIEKFTAIIFVSITIHNSVCAEEFKENSLGMRFAYCPPGKFQMGSPPHERDSEDDEVLRQVTLSTGFYIGVTEVTQEQYQKVMGSNPSYFQGDRVAVREQSTGRIKISIDTSHFPAESMTWDDANEFCRRLTQSPDETLSGRSYRLPTEAEWEYACRAGSKWRYSFGSSDRKLMGAAWFVTNSADRVIDPKLYLGHTMEETHRLLKLHGNRVWPVASKEANAWGLYDMHGNVWEFCADWYGPYQSGPAVDPKGPPRGELVVVRGGGWCGQASSCRSASRDRTRPDKGDWVNGFRVVLTER